MTDQDDRNDRMRGEGELLAEVRNIRERVQDLRVEVRTGFLKAEDDMRSIAQRLVALENWKMWMIGAIAALGLVLTLMMGLGLWKR